MAQLDGSFSTVRPATPPRPRLRTPPTTPRKAPSSSSSPAPKSPRNPENAFWVAEQRRKAYSGHLEKWARNHDSSTHFRGTIQIISPETQIDNLDLGKSVKCVLSDSEWLDARRHVVIRLFAPHEQKGERHNNSSYRLLIRFGSGWIIAREFLEREYFANRRMAGREYRPRADYSHHNITPARRSNLLGKRPEGNAVRIGPLFHPFLRLPVELQEYILTIAVNKTDIHRPGKRNSGFQKYITTKQDSTLRALVQVVSQTSLPNVLCLSKSLNSHLVPYFYRTTTFYFGTQDWTYFLWLVGPYNRGQVRKITLAFGSFALLHCMRWFVPDPIFEAFGPEMGLCPRGMQFYWRCQIRDYVRELHLKVLNINLAHIPEKDLPLMIRSLRTCCAEIQTIRFNYNGVAIANDDPKLRLLGEAKSWGELCKDAFLRYRYTVDHSTMFRAEVTQMSVEEFEAKFAANREFFDRVESSL